MIYKTTLYLHADKSANRVQYKSLCKEYNVGPVGAAEDEFSWVGCEVALDLEVDLDTGKAVCVGVQGVALTEPVKL